MVFLTVLAWIFGVLSTLTVLLKIVLSLWYEFSKSGQLQQTLDKLQGKRYSFPIIVPGTVAIICWVWIFTQ